MTTPATPAEVPAQEIPAEEITPVRSSALARLSDGEPDAAGSISAFASLDNFRAAQSMALSLAASTIVPEAYRGRANLGNVLVALELAARVRASVLMVMQNLHVIEGKPSWSSAFQIASVNASGRFTPLRFVFEGEREKDGWSCYAVATDKATGEELKGEPITWKMVKAEGWLTRRGSKWQTMPGQMMRYRSAAFWTRVYAPEISLGMHTTDEVEDFTGASPVANPRTQDLNAALEVATDRAAARVATAADAERHAAPAIATRDCEDCGAKTGEPHKDACPLA